MDSSHKYRQTPRRVFYSAWRTKTVSWKILFVLQNESQYISICAAEYSRQNFETEHKFSKEYYSRREIVYNVEVRKICALSLFWSTILYTIHCLQFFIFNLLYLTFCKSLAQKRVHWILERHREVISIMIVDNGMPCLHLSKSELLEVIKIPLPSFSNCFFLHYEAVVMVHWLEKLTNF